MQNATADQGTADVATRIAAATQSRRRRPDYPTEVRALLDAARQVIEANGTATRAKVSDIVAAAGLSNEAFYRHFASKDALIGAIVEDGAERVARNLAVQMSRESSPQDQVRCWLMGLLATVEGRQAEQTLAVLSNSSNLNSALPAGSRGARAPLAALLHDPFVALGSQHPAWDADLVTDGVIGTIARHTRDRSKPSDEEVEHLLRFCQLAAASSQRRA